ncbi:MAG TPA: HlyD family efflux transporter periplasmic adaptor subunit [Gemmatimonadaceae bacterium]|nr:HlyD family efflux transporter periplasmic adaptor subunit [Gemmatimonadaceae bacterium]
MSRAPQRLFMPLAATALTVALAACQHAPAPDAYGNFEATEVVVSAQGSGQLLWFTPQEGQQLASGALVGVIDTTQLALELAQVLAQQAASRSHATQVGQQIDVLTVQRRIAQRAYERTQRLFAQQAATAQQLDQTERDFRVLGQQIQATQTERRTAGQDAAAARARVSQIAERIRRSRVTTPVGGTVLATYARAGEFVQPGQPLFKVAKLDSLDLRAYVTEAQLASVRLGQHADVSIDTGADQRRVLPGRVTWISANAEFTPTPIQTRDERTDLVYAIKVRVANPGGIVKIGMPADVRFAPTAGAGPTESAASGSSAPSGGSAAPTERVSQ